MAKYNLSVIIPARNEMFLKDTVEDLLKNIRGKTEIIVGLDGEWAEPPVSDNPIVTLVNVGESIGQRAITNMCARLSKSKYLAKVDAHCAFDEGFDVKMMAEMKDDWTMVPLMKNLHVFDWVCQKGHRRYQGISGPCTECGEETTREIVWNAKGNPVSTSYCFNTEPHFQYFRDFKSRPEGKGDITPTMSLQGSFFMCTRDKYWELELCDESFGSWGSQGIEVAIKTWLSGGQVMCNHKTWYGHMFRTKGGDFGFPWPASGRQIQGAKKHAREIFFNNRWPKQKYPLSWLIKKFWPIPGWTEEALAEIQKNKPREGPPSPGSNRTKGIVYYSDNRIDPDLGGMVQQRILSAGLPIVSVTLKPLDFGKNIVLDLERSYLTMFKQILAGLENIGTDIVFLCEHDVLYAKEHFDFIPPTEDMYYYNANNWQVRQSDGFSLYWDCKKVSQLCAYRELLLQHYKERVRRVKSEGFTRKMGFEPGSHNRPERVDDIKSGTWRTAIANLDIRHANNLTSSRWSQDKFRNKPKNWAETHVNKLPGWEGLKL